MGCFLSTNKATPTPHSTKTRRPQPPSPPPPPPLPVEETVKEVLSETPKSKPIYKNTLKEDSKKMVDKESVFQEKRDARHFKKTPEKIADHRDEVSEISEIYSIFSESISASTERRENEEGQQRVLRSPEKFKRRALSGDSTANKVKSVVTRPDLSPNRARIVSGRERRGVIKDVGESSRRRSRSPVIRNNDVVMTRQSLGRSPSLRNTGKSPGRIKSDLAEKSRRNMAATSSELLENPLVSLECFIFL